MGESNYSTNDAAQAFAEAAEKMRALGEVLREALDAMGHAEAMIRAYSSEKTPLPAPGHSALGISERARLIERCSAHKSSAQIDDTCHECEALFDASKGACDECGAPGSFSCCPGCGERYCQRCAERPYEFCACIDEPKESELK